MRVQFLRSPWGYDFEAVPVFLISFFMSLARLVAGQNLWFGARISFNWSCNVMSQVLAPSKFWRWKAIRNGGLQEEDKTLHEAARLGQADRVRELISQGSKATAKDNSGYSALHWASLYGHVEVSLSPICLRRIWSRAEIRTRSECQLCVLCKQCGLPELPLLYLVPNRIVFIVIYGIKWPVGKFPWKKENPLEACSHQISNNFARKRSERVLKTLQFRFVERIARWWEHF